jgi:hypothetical protein
MRTYGRLTDVLTRQKTWVEVDTAPDDSNDMVMLTTLCQCLKLNLGESPFYANYGIPARESVVSQIFPDYDVMKTQSQFAPFFAALIITKQPGSTPSYIIDVMDHQGVKQSVGIPI